MLWGHYRESHDKCCVNQCRGKGLWNICFHCVFIDSAALWTVHIKKQKRPNDIADYHLPFLKCAVHSYSDPNVVLETLPQVDFFSFRSFYITNIIARGLTEGRESRQDNGLTWNRKHSMTDPSHLNVDVWCYLMLVWLLQRNLMPSVFLYGSVRSVRSTHNLAISVL